jgi:hypothetical protein
VRGLLPELMVWKRRKGKEEGAITTAYSDDGRIMTITKRSLQLQHEYVDVSCFVRGSVSGK